MPNWNTCLRMVRDREIVFGWGQPTPDEIRALLPPGTLVFVTRTSDITASEACPVKGVKLALLRRQPLHFSELQPWYLTVGRMVHKAAAVLEDRVLSADAVALHCCDQLSLEALTARSTNDYKELESTAVWLPDLLALYERRLSEGDLAGSILATEQIVWMLIPPADDHSYAVLVMEQHDIIRRDSLGALEVFDRKTVAPNLDMSEDLQLRTMDYQLGAVYPFTLLGLLQQGHPAVAGASGFGGVQLQYWSRQRQPPTVESVIAGKPAYCDKCVEVLEADGLVPYEIRVNTAMHPRMSPERLVEEAAEQHAKFNKHLAAIRDAQRFRDSFEYTAIVEHPLPVTDSTIAARMRSFLQSCWELGDIACATPQARARLRLNSSACRSRYGTCQFLGTKYCPAPAADDLLGPGWEPREDDYTTKLQTMINPLPVFRTKEPWKSLFI